MSDKETIKPAVIEQKSFPCVVFQSIKKMGTGGEDKMIDTKQYWYLNVQQGHRSTEKINQFIRAGNKVVGHQNLDRDYRLPNGQMVRAVNFNEIRSYVDMMTGKGLDPRLAGNDEHTDPLAEKIEDAKKREIRK